MVNSRTRTFGSAGSCDGGGSRWQRRLCVKRRHRRRIDQSLGTEVWTTVLAMECPETQGKTSSQVTISNRLAIRKQMKTSDNGLTALNNGGSRRGWIRASSSPASIGWLGYHTRRADSRRPQISRHWESGCRPSV